MKIQGVLLATEDEQRAGGDQLPVDPANIRHMNPTDHIPVMIDFDPTLILGRVTKTWLEDGRLMFEAEINDDWLARYEDSKPRPQGSAGLTIHGTEDHRVKDAGLWAVSLTDQNVNKNQPPWRKVE
jgi:hypothetical protein